MSQNQENIVSIRTRATGTGPTISRMREVQTEIKNNARIARQSSHSITASNRTVTRSLDDQARRAQRAASDLATAVERANLRIIRSNERAAKSFQQARGAQQPTFGGGGGGGFSNALLGGATVAGGVVLGLNAIKAYDSQEGFKRMMRFQYGPGMGESMYRQTRNLSDELGLPMGEVSQGLKGLSNVLSSSELIDTMKAFVAVGFRSGATSEQMSRALIQYTQVAMSGKLQGDELRLMQENGVNIKGLIMRSGLGSRIGSQTDPITFKEINDLLLKEGQTAESQQMLAEAGNTGSAALARMQNVIDQDLLPAIGEELTPAIKKAADMLPIGAAYAKTFIQNWERIVIPIGIVMGAYKVAQVASTLSAWRFTAAMNAATAAAKRNGMADMFGGGARRGGRGGVPRTPGRYSDTLGDPAVVKDALKNRGGNWGSKVPWYARPIGGAAGSVLGGAAIGATTGAVIATAAGLIDLAGAALTPGNRSKGIGSDADMRGRSVDASVAGLNTDDTWMATGLVGAAANALAGQGLQSTAQIEGKKVHEARLKWESVQAARERFRQFQMKHGRTSMEYYAYKTQDLAVFGDPEVARARMAAFAAQYESGLANSVSSRTPVNSSSMSPRRAGVDNQLAENTVRVQRGVGA
ncbi:MAG: tape measure protein [Bryobacteraceae bacterium]